MKFIGAKRVLEYFNSENNSENEPDVYKINDEIRKKLQKLANLLNRNLDFWNE